jgi:hypothetical protein
MTQNSGALMTNSNVSVQSATTTQPAMGLLAFVDACEQLLASNGEPHLAGARLFTDNGLHIHQRESGDLTITLYYGDQNGEPTLNNPVIMRGPNCHIYRAHGEWVYGIPRVQEYLNGGSKGGLIDCPNYYYVTEKK